MTEFQVTEIFHSLQGEGRTTGFRTVFVRLTGCPLRCNYCDTRYAFSGGTRLSLDDIVQQVADYQVRHVTVTGGEPMAQEGVVLLLTRLCDLGYEVSLETSGAIDLSAIDTRVVKVMDLKTPASGEETSNHYENIALLNQRDQLKFVICDRGDYEWSCAMINKYRLAERCELLFSPCHGYMEPTQLADWIVNDRLPVRFQLQLHRLLWGEQTGK